MYALLTIYVLQKVKRYVRYCGGQYSQVACIGATTKYIFDEIVEAAESLFSQYDQKAVRTFITTIMEKQDWAGFDDDADQETLLGVQQLRHDFRVLIERMGCQPFKFPYGG